MKPREFFATAPRAAKVRPPFTLHNNQTWKCIVCGQDMEGKCTPAGRFDSASCFHCYTEFYVDADGTIAACDIPKPLKKRFPLNPLIWGPKFLEHPIHLHHDHRSGLTVGATHAYCNAILAQYYGQ